MRVRGEGSGDFKRRQSEVPGGQEFFLEEQRLGRTPCLNQRERASRADRSSERGPKSRFGEGEIVEGSRTSVEGDRRIFKRKGEGLFSEGGTEATGEAPELFSTSYRKEGFARRGRAIEGSGGGCRLRNVKNASWDRRWW